MPKEFAQLNGIDCDKYDLRLVDEDGDECIVQDLNLCDEDAHVEINDQNLLSCQGWSMAK